jgi:hypothetical protein
LFGFLHQPFLHRIAMHIAQLFHALALAPHVEIVKSLLPNMLRRFGQGTACRGLRRLPFRTRRANRCFTTCITVEGVPRSGSLMSR